MAIHKFLALILKNGNALLTLKEFESKWNEKRNEILLERNEFAISSKSLNIQELSMEQIRSIIGKLPKEDLIQMLNS